MNQRSEQKQRSAILSQQSYVPGTHPHLYKIVLVGDAGVGKTHLVNRFVRKQLPTRNVSTIGVEFANLTIDLKDGGKVKAQIWDTAGQERYRAITAAHYRKAVGALIVYDITNSRTFESTQNWLEEVKSAADENIVVMLVGNKLDVVEQTPQSRRVLRDDAQHYATKKGMLFRELSSYSQADTDEAFEKLIDDIYEQKQRIDANEMSQLSISYQNTQREQRVLQPRVPSASAIVIRGAHQPTGRQQQGSQDQTQDTLSGALEGQVQTTLRHETAETSYCGCQQ